MSKPSVHEKHKFEPDMTLNRERGVEACVCGLDGRNSIHEGAVTGTQALPDSGLRRSFGEKLASREADPTKPALEGVSPYLKLALGRLLAKADVKYKEQGGYRNWEKGIPVMRCVGAIDRHLTAFQLCDESEDHLAAIAWNAMVLIHYRDGGTINGVSFEELDDRPKWFKAPK